MELASIRYVLALIWLLALPVFLFWIGLHPFVRFWRRMGLAATYLLLLAGCAAVSLLLFAWRDALLAVEFGTHPALWAATAVLYLAAAAVEVQARRHLRPRILVGVPELKGEAGPTDLLDQGIYARIRHPRYVGITLGYLSSACLANYLFLWAAVPVLLLAIHTIVLMEERELVLRFGDAYVEYMRAVPRYLPRLG